MFFIKSESKTATVAAEKNVATVMVRNGDKILMGKRNDNGRYTNPGGHFEAGETPEQAAVRELYEEAGIKVKESDLEHLDTKEVTTFTGKKLKIHAFIVETNQKPTAKNDPDEEVDKWEWIDISEGLPEEIGENLHSKENVALKKMGLQKSELYDLFAEFFKPMFETMSVGEVLENQAKKIMSKGTPMSVRLERMYARKGKIRPVQEGYTDQFTKNLKEALGQKSEFFVMDLVKGATGGHKYLRKYMRGGQWIYVYHEGTQHGRRLDPHHHEIIRRLAESGHAESRALIDSTEEHAPAKLEALRRLADSGHQPSHEHLRSLGIDREQEKLEEKLVPRQVKQKDVIDQELSEQDKNKALEKIKGALQQGIFGHLQGHQTSPFYTSLQRAGITLDSVMAEIGTASTRKEMLKKLHEAMKKIDVAHRPHGTPQNSNASQNGGYGGLGYKRSVEALEGAGLLPTKYASTHKRGEEPHSFKEHDAKLEEARQAELRERQEREAREARELAEVHGSMAHHMATLAGGRMSTSEIKELHRKMSAMFGKNMRKEDWPYDFSADGYDVKISALRTTSTGFSADFKVTDRNGNDVVRQWSRTWSKVGGVVDIHNDYLAVNSSSRGSDKPIGSLINQAQMKFLKSHAPNGQISVFAALNVGGYNWANQGFSFESRDTMRSFQNEFKTYLRRHGINLTDQEAAQFTLPCHFASFDTGKKVVRTVTDPIGLSARQKEAGTLSGKPDGTPLTAEERRSGRTNRIECHLGKDFLLGKNWNGVIKVSEMNDSNEAYKYFKNYETQRNAAWKNFNAGTKAVFERNQGHTVPAGAPAIESAPATGPPSTPRRATRPRNFGTWTPERQQQWYDANHTRMSSAARIAIRRVMRDTRSRSSGSDPIPF